MPDVPRFGCAVIALTLGAPLMWRPATPAEAGQSSSTVRAGGEPTRPRGTAEADPKAPANRLGGVWLVDAADRSDGTSWLSAAWSSQVILAGDSFTITHFWGSPGELTGTFVLDASGSGTIDLKVNEFILSEARKLKYPACTLPGIYRLDGDRLSVCFSVGPDPRRPSELRPSGNKEIMLRLVRGGAEFKDFPKDVTVTVLDPAGKPAAGIELYGWLVHAKRDGQPGWTYSRPWGRAGADGTVKVRYADLPHHGLIAHDGDRKLTGFASVSPVSLRDGVVTVRLGPERLVTGTITYEGPANEGKAAKGGNLYLWTAGQRVGIFLSTSQFSFALPPGAYTFQVYGEQTQHKFVSLTVPPGEGEIRVPPIQLSPVRFFDGAGVKREAAREGNAAPELEGVAGWKGEPVRLADLRGKVVLLNFWGYWCGPCVSEMPVLIELHQRFKDKGLLIVGVHVDQDGSCDTAAKLDATIARIRKEYWGGKDLPFPVALVSGKLSRDGRGPAREYGVTKYPTTVIIDRQGNVAGEFGAFGPKDIDKAVAAAEKLLQSRN